MKNDLNRSLQYDCYFREYAIAKECMAEKAKANCQICDYLRRDTFNPFCPNDTDPWLQVNGTTLFIILIMPCISVSARILERPLALMPSRSCWFSVVEMLVSVFCQLFLNDKDILILVLSSNCFNKPINFRFFHYIVYRVCHFWARGPRKVPLLTYIAVQIANSWITKVSAICNPTTACS